MSSKYHQECIITNCTDFFCLICECYILSEGDAVKHISKPIHKKILAATRYLETYEEDHIRKVPKGYYCEYCSIFICTPPKVKLHVADNSHASNKGTSQLKRLNNNLIYNELLISEDSWHGLKESSCSVCDANFYCRDLHKSSPSHILNLMQKKIEFGPRNFIYRLLDENTFQCLTCNTISALKSIDLHVRDLFHNENLKKCNKIYHSSLNNNEIFKYPPNEPHAHDLLDSVVNITKTEKNENSVEMVRDVTQENKSVLLDSTDNNFNSSVQYFETEHVSKDIKISRDDNKEKILDSVIYFAKNEININFETEMGYCKKCFKNIAFDFDLINEHIDTDKRSNVQREVRDYVPYACDVNISRVDKDNKNFNTNSVRSISSCDDDKHFKNIDEVSRNNNGENITSGSDSAINNAESKEKDTVKSSNNVGVHATASNENTDDTKSYAQENHLTYNKTNSNAYCRICETRIPASSLKCMKEHVNGTKHQKNVLRKKTQEKRLTMSLRRFIDHVIMKVHRFVFFVVRVEYVFINRKYCLTGESYNLIIKRGMRLRCILCEETVDKDDVLEHCDSNSHERALMAVPVVITLGNEFVREVGRGLYHCGFCNLILSNWEELHQHLQCTEHNDAKAKANVILMAHMPTLRNADSNFF